MSFTWCEFSIRPSVQYNSIPWLRAGRTDNRLQIKQQHGIGSYIFYGLLTFTQEAQGKAEGLECWICRLPRQWQVLQPYTAVILLSVDFSWYLLAAKTFVMWILIPAELITRTSAEYGFPQSGFLCSTHNNFHFFWERQSALFISPVYYGLFALCLGLFVLSLMGLCPQLLNCAMRSDHRLLGRTKGALHGRALCWIVFLMNVVAMCFITKLGTYVPKCSQPWTELL